MDSVASSESVVDSALEGLEPEAAACSLNVGPLVIDVVMMSMSLSLSETCLAVFAVGGPDAV